MARRLSLTNKSSNEIYLLPYPKNILTFIKYDFTMFMERCTDICRLYMKTGMYRSEEVIDIRNSIGGCHKFVEQNIRGVFEKVVIDCWIEYICRLNEIGVVTLWNNFIPCRTDFEKIIFSRLSEYRHNHAINQWVNILKIQEYAKTKVEFVFGQKLKNTTEASTRSNYFDLMFNVAANEMGYDVGDVADNKVYTLGRTPNSPFIMSNISREIVRNMLSDVKFFDDTKHKGLKGDFLADQTAMDAFSAIKAYIPEESDLALGTMIKSLTEAPQKVYMPTSFKAVIDLEIDAIIESDAYLQRCERCRDYYLRSEEYDYDYCDKVNREGVSCIEVMSRDSEAARKKDKTIDAGLLSLRCDQLYREMSARVNVDITQRDFSDWYKYMMLIRDNVLSGAATLEDFESFIEYSRSMAFLPQAPQKESIEDISDEPVQAVASPKPEKVQYDAQGREIKPFVFEKLDRNSLDNDVSGDYFSTTFVKKRTYSEPVQPVYQTPQSSKVIRGAVTPPVYDNSFIEPSVIIPYGEEDNTSYEEKSIPTFYNSFETEDDLEDDMKIYTVKEPAPEVKKEFVKVFEPGGRKKKRGTENREEALPDSEIKQIQHIKPLQSTQAIMPESKLDSFLHNSSLAAEREHADLIEKKRQERERQADKVKPESKVTYAANSYRSVGASQTPAIPAPPPKHDELKFSRTIEERNEPVEFNEILEKGFERKDGFEESEIPTDADGVPVSHKTKRVMDAIFKQAKPSLFININKDE